MPPSRRPLPRLRLPSCQPRGRNSWGPPGGAGQGPATTALVRPVRGNRHPGLPSPVVGTVGAFLGTGLGVCPDGAVTDMQMRFQCHSGPRCSQGCHRSRDKPSTDLTSFRPGWNRLGDCPLRARAGKVSCLGASLTWPLPEARPGRSAVRSWQTQGEEALPSPPEAGRGHFQQGRVFSQVTPVLEGSIVRAVTA